MAKTKVRPEDEQPSNRALTSATRPKARPTAPKTSKRPPQKMPMIDLPSPREEEPKKMAAGGMCRGMGAATRGGKFTKNG